MDIFDLHCDTLTTAMNYSADLTDNHLAIFFPLDRSIKKHTQCFAIFCPDTIRGEFAYNYYKIAKKYFDDELKKFSQYFAFCRNVNEINMATDSAKTAAILTVEGGAVLAGNLKNIQNLYDDGVRMMTLTWNGENELGCGSSEQSFALKPFGFEVIKEMAKIRMIIDVSHLSDKGFDDVAKTVSVPFAASHSNLRSVCNNRRNLNDERFTEIVRRKGLVGINFYKDFLNDDGENATIDDISLHIEKMLMLGSEDVIALGSDYDGCDVVSGIKMQRDIGLLYNSLIEHGFGEKLVNKIFYENAYRFFAENI